MDTIFHKIIRREVPATVVYEDTDVLAIKDIHPKAATHLLFLPKSFVPSIAEVSEETAHVPGVLINAARKFAQVHGLEGYKLLFNVGAKGGQEVFYLHLHLMSDQSLEA